MLRLLFGTQRYENVNNCSGNECPAGATYIPQSEILFLAYWLSFSIYIRACYLFTIMAHWTAIHCAALISDLSSHSVIHLNELWQDGIELLVNTCTCINKATWLSYSVHDFDNCTWIWLKLIKSIVPYWVAANTSNSLNLFRL